MRNSEPHLIFSKVNLFFWVSSFVLLCISFFLTVKAMIFTSDICSNMNHKGVKEWLKYFCFQEKTLNKNQVME